MNIKQSDNMKLFNALKTLINMGIDINEISLHDMSVYDDDLFVYRKDHKDHLVHNGVKIASSYIIYKSIDGVVFSGIYDFWGGEKTFEYNIKYKNIKTWNIKWKEEGIAYASVGNDKNKRDLNR